MRADVYNLFKAICQIDEMGKIVCGRVGESFFGVDKCLKDLQETCFLEHRAKFSISRSQNPSIVVLSRGQNLGKSWSKSFVLENKVVLNFDFRHGANKSGQLNHLLHAKLWSNRFQYITIYFTKSWFPRVSYQLDQKEKYCH